MPELSLRDFLETRDILKSNRYLETSLESDTNVVEAINDLLFVSALTARNDKIGIHPVVFMNSMKNIIGDDRKNPSLTLLKFAVDYVLGFEFRKNDQKLINESLQDGAGLTAFIGDLEDACQNGDWEKGSSLAAHIFSASDNSHVAVSFSTSNFLTISFSINMVYLLDLIPRPFSDLSTSAPMALVKLRKGSPIIKILSPTP